MIIVSQDKTHIFNFDNINYLYVSKISDYDFAIEINYNDCNYSVIAKYSTEERAKEVLQEIINKYKTYDTWYHNKIEIAYLQKPKVYEMPLE